MYTSFPLTNAAGWWMRWLIKYTNKECAVTLHNMATFYPPIPTLVTVKININCDKYIDCHVGLVL